jgi:hypothetical protein
MRLERLRSMVPLTGEADSGARCSPALIVAAACREDKEGERGEGGPGGVTMASAPAKEMRRDPLARGEPDVDVREAWCRVLMSGVIGMMGRWVMVVGRAVQRRKQGVVFGEWRRDKEM